MKILLLALLALVASGQSFTWVIQNIYRSPNTCVPEDLISINSWRHDICVKFDATRWNKRTCNDTAIASIMYSDAGCTQEISQQAFPANRCGAAQPGPGSGSTTLSGVFFACATLDSPPSLPNQNNDVFNDLQYFKGSTQCNPADIYQSLSYIANNVCVLGEKRSCVCNGGSCTGYTLDKCDATPSGAVTSTGVCRNTTSDQFDNKAECLAAVTPTAAPPDPTNPPGTDPSTLAACSAATTRDQCTGGALVNGEPTLPITGLINKCCVWCADSQGGGSCIEPGFSSKTCNCPANSTSVVSLQDIYKCPSGQTSGFVCSCSGRPFGAASCTDSAGTPPGGGNFAAMVSPSMALAFLLMLYFSM